MSNRQEMRPSDWGNSAVNIVIGVFLGLAAVGMAELILGGNWFFVVLVVVLFSGVMLFDRGLERLWDWSYRIGTNRVPPRKVARRKPWIRRLSLPAGLLMGVVLSLVGLGDTILSLL